MNEFLPCPTID